MQIDELENNIAQDLAVDLLDEFDRNFERKGFFTDKWPQAKLINNKGSLMMRSGNLRRSIEYDVKKNTISFTSSLPYAAIHNEGGEITVTEKMKRYFWAMYKQAKGVQASQWKALALMKVGHKIKVTKRQMVGNHPQVAGIVKDVIDRNMAEFNNELAKQFKK
ncbi:hypothetical protein GCM10007424_23650 [Flavobacterium suaedae]|uniref:Phage morphogenesis protein n=1 Tax=Flavobacterium suaedae TaxID=1767027 RepID=A0ABQ1K2F0_9FLAO|nr:phage virion morphogenesis protein [Flavobacterium suaedae]GGB82894.1 hypothetical protein GCM10007424_23650 [Flavobacterium suaedae]